MGRFVALYLLASSLLFAFPDSASAQRTSGEKREAFPLAAQRPGETDVYILSFGLWGPQSVFESEARGAARILENTFGAKGRSIVRYNTKSRAGADAATLMGAARALGKVLDPGNDVAILVVTSHGGPQGVGLVTPRSQGVLTPRDVGKLLEATGARYRVLIVSACFSGVFANALADERTLVITAAAADRSSFGCRDGAAWTYFGDAFFNRSVRTERRLDRAFENARDLVTQRERRERYEPSNPQIAGGALVLEHLAKSAIARTQP